MAFVVSANRPAANANRWLDFLKGVIMEITQEQAKIIHEWFSKLLASDPSKVRGSDFELARVIRDASQQGVQADLLPCGHSVDSLGGFGGCNPNGSCMECAATSR